VIEVKAPKLEKHAKSEFVLSQKDLAAQKREEEFRKQEELIQKLQR
jgi:hypothetical protein